MTDSKEHILKTSFSLFLQKSYKEVTMNELVTAAGLSKGAFYHYFESKEKLFSEVIDTFYFRNMTIDYSKLSHESLYNFYHDYAKEITKLINESKTFLDTKDREANINYFIMMFDALKLFPDFRDKLRETQQKDLDAWSAIVEIGREKGEFESPMSDEQIARMFIYSIDGIAVYLLMNGSYENIENEMIKLWDNFYKEVKD
ncbi:MAG: TetR/AcrR family transcriptional regulator [Bacteroidetes bacterium]|nr:TetR/AcrR family transcriptional regulator [Bacteroidota bacterium]